MRLVPTLDGKEFEAAAFLHGNFRTTLTVFKSGIPRNRVSEFLVELYEPSGGPPGISTISPPQHGGRNSQEMGLTVKVKGWLGSLRERRGATILRALALSAGAFLVVTGVIGLSAIAFGELVYFVGSIYTIIFGLTALVVEVKHKLPLVGIAYEWIDTYLKFLTVQRGKGVRRVPHRAT